MEGGGTMRLLRPLFLVLVTSCVVQFQSLAQRNPLQSPAKTPSSFCDPGEKNLYEAWMRPFRKGPLQGGFNEKNPIELAITIFRGGVQSNSKSSVKKMRLIRAGMVTTFRVSTAGTVSMTRVTAWAVQGGGPGKLPERNFKKLLPLMADLPSDYSRLPPKGRRIVVQVATSKGIVARVYDRANAPEKVLEMLRLIGADPWPIYKFPNFKPDGKWGKENISQAGLDQSELNAVGLDYLHYRVLATSPDGKLVVTESGQYLAPAVRTELLKKSYGKSPVSDDTVLKIVSANGATVHEFRQRNLGRRYIYDYAAHFTPDGRYLLVMNSIPGMRIYDTSSWKRVDQLPMVPKGALAYYPSHDWKRAVAVFPSGEIGLLDTETGRVLARIDPGDDLQYVSYSSNGSRVATVTERVRPGHAYEAHLRIWSTATGHLLHELWPWEATSHDGFGKPVWSPGGKYLFAPARFVVGIWNSETGRYRGTLAGCTLPEDEDSLVVLVGHSAFRKCGYYGLLRWNAESVLSKIGHFEKSLSNCCSPCVHQ